MKDTNRLLRQYFPLARQLNEPTNGDGKTLTFETPAERFNAWVASIG